jgi:putative ATP-dependent endonuclease of the OLD family
MHLAALTHLKTSELKARMPSVLADVLEHVAKSLRRD